MAGNENLCIHRKPMRASTQNKVLKIYREYAEKRKPVRSEPYTYKKNELISGNFGCL